MKTIALGAIIGIVAFYAGQHHALLKKLKKQRPPVYADMDVTSSLQVWATAFTQAAEAHRGAIKTLAIGNIAGLAICGAILGASSPKLSGFLYLSTLMFALGLIASALPKAALWEQYRDDSHRIAIAIANQGRVPLPSPTPSGLRNHAQKVTLAFTGLGITAFAVHLLTIGAIDEILDSFELLQSLIKSTQEP